MVSTLKPGTFSTWVLMSALVMLFVCTPARLRAQVSGATLTGSVTDPSGAVIPNAKVSIKNTATGIITNATTNSAGLYTVPNLIPGPYQVTVSAQGFQTEVRSGITLTVGAQQALNISLRVGQTTQTISVSGQAPTVELASSTLAAQVNSATVRQLPLNGRDWASLATLQPGVAQVRTQESITQVGGAARGIGMQMTIDGNRPTQNSYRLDGIIINDYSNAGPGSVLGQNLGVDAIQEFSVLTNNYSAEYGFTSGGVVNAITRSGTNQFHGSAYEFLRNSNLDAANSFDNAGNITKPPFRRNQFGASAGGPIKKDKIFIFGDYEGLRQSLGVTNTSLTPSANARLGNIHDAAGNPITVPVDPNIAKFFTFYPLPNIGLIGNGDTGNYAFAGQEVVPENYWTTRGDVRISDKDSMYASWYWDNSTLSQPDLLNQVLDGFTSLRTGGGVEETHIFSPATVNTVRVGWNRTVMDSGQTLKAINPAAADPSLGMITGFFAPRIHVPGLQQFTGGLRGQSVQNYISQMFQVYDDAFHTVGNHSLKFGFEFLKIQDNVYAPFIEDGTVNFSSLANFLQNISHTVSGPPSVAAITPHNDRDSVFGGYLQDDWKARPNLTLNLGLRYEMATIPAEVQGKIANLPTIFTNPGSCVATSGGSTTAQSCPALNKFYYGSNPTAKNFEPRVGFAWDPFHDGKTAIRGGFGVFDALPLPYELVLNNAQTSPFHVSGTAFNPPQGSFPFGIEPLITNPPDSAQTWNFNDVNPKRNYVFQWNFNIQRQLTPSTAVTLAYAGSHGVHQPFQVDTVTQVMPALTPAGYLYPNPIGSGTTNNPNASMVQTTMWMSYSIYNSLQAEVVKRMSHGVQLQGSFTWSKAIDTSSGSFAGDNYAESYSNLPWFNLNLDRGLADYNVGRNLVINALWDIPTPKSLGGPAGWLAKGWEMGGILSLSDGVPFTPTLGQEGDPQGTLSGEPWQVPDVVASPACTPLINPGNPNAYVKANCFTIPSAPSLAYWNANCDPNPPIAPNGSRVPVTFPQCWNLLGNAGRNIMVGPGLADFDFSLLKDNRIPRISENFDIQFRAEFFNVLNRANFAPPPEGNLEAIDATGASVAGFGAITATQTPAREIQFAIKVIW